MDDKKEALLGAVLMGVIAVAQELAKEKDNQLKSLDWRQSFADQLIERMKQDLVMGGISIDDEPAFYDAVFSGIRLALKQADGD